MAVIGELAVNVVARTDKLIKGLASSRKQISGMTKQFKAAAVGVTKFASAAIGIAGGLGAAGIAASMRNAALEIDKVAKTSKKLGIAIDALAGLRVAAERTGVATNQLETGLQRMTRRVAEAARGTGEAKDAIAELGLDAQKLNAMSPDQVFVAISKAMQGVTNQADKVRLGFKLFDTEGVNLIRTMPLVARGLKDVIAEADRLGQVFTADQAARVEEMNDQLDRLKASFSKLGTKLVIDIAPKASELIEGILAITAPEKKGEGMLSTAGLERLREVNARLPKAYDKYVGRKRTAERFGTPFFGANINKIVEDRRKAALGEFGELYRERERLQSGDERGFRRSSFMSQQFPMTIAAGRAIGRLGGLGPAADRAMSQGGLPLRPGEVMSPKEARELMSPKEARRLVAVNEQMLQVARRAEARDMETLKAIKEQQAKLPEPDPFAVTIP